MPISCAKMRSALRMVLAGGVGFWVLLRLLLLRWCTLIRIQPLIRIRPRRHIRIRVFHALQPRPHLRRQQSHHVSTDTTDCIGTRTRTRIDQAAVHIIITTIIIIHMSHRDRRRYRRQRSLRVG